MREIILAAAAALALAGAAAADPAAGLWQTEPDEGNFAFVQIEPCGPAVCGTIVRTFSADGEYQSPNLGRQIVIDMVPVGDGDYQGQVWRPSNDKIYVGRMTLDGDQLRLRGCILNGAICSAQDWVRVQ